MIRVDFGPISETVYIDIILNYEFKILYNTHAIKHFS
jgi:hypothetical protein